jgi:Arc/MetJ-type ribon-helix-helix transcriptional regulator
MLVKKRVSLRVEQIERLQSYVREGTLGSFSEGVRIAVDRLLDSLDRKRTKKAEIKGGKR